jgi:hypothetical protein
MKIESLRKLIPQYDKWLSELRLKLPFMSGREKQEALDGEQRLINGLKEFPKQIKVLEEELYGFPTEEAPAEEAPAEEAPAEEAPAEEAPAEEAPTEEAQPTSSGAEEAQAGGSQRRSRRSKNKRKTRRSRKQRKIEVGRSGK